MFLRLLGSAMLAIASMGSLAVAEERVVVIPNDSTPFNVRQDEFVRITGRGIAGTKIVAAIDGPAKVVAENMVSVRAKGKALVGPGNREFEIQPTGKGAVKVTITTTPPTGEKPTATEYEFTVE